MNGRTVSITRANASRSPHWARVMRSRTSASGRNGVSVIITAGRILFPSEQSNVRPLRGHDKRNQRTGRDANRPPLSAPADGELDPRRRAEVRFPMSIRTVFLAVSLSTSALAQQTIAEKTDFRATSRHADVIAFCTELAKKSPVV